MWGEGEGRAGAGDGVWGAPRGGWGIKRASGEISRINNAMKNRKRYQWSKCLPTRYEKSSPNTGMRGRVFYSPTHGLVIDFAVIFPDRVHVASCTRTVNVLIQLSLAREGHTLLLLIPGHIYAGYEPK